MKADIELNFIYLFIFKANLWSFFFLKKKKTSLKATQACAYGKRWVGGCVRGMQAHSSIAVTSPEGLVQRHQDSVFSLLYTSEVSPQYYSVITSLMRVHVCCDLIGDIWFYIISILNRCYVAIRLQTGHCSISGHTHTIYWHTHTISGP